MNSLPHGWARAAVRDVVVEARPGFPSGRHNSAGLGIPHLRPMNISRDGHIDLENVKYVEEGGDARIERDDVLFNNTNSPDLVGKTAYFDRNGEWAYSNHMTRLRPSAEVDGRFLALQLHWLWMRGFYKSILSHHVNQASVATKTLLARVELDIPPLAEQRRIVAAIEEQHSRVDRATDLLRAAQRRLDRLRERAADLIVVQEGDVRSIGDLAEVQGGIQKQPKRRPVTNRFPFLRVANVLRGRLDLAEIHEVELFDGELDRYMLRPGDLLVVEGNGSPNQIGRSALWHGEIDPCVHQNHLIRVRPGEEIDSRYLDLWWNAPSVARRIASVASSTSGLYTLSAAKVRAVTMVVPSRDEQMRLVATVEEQLARIELLSRAIALASARAASLRRAVLARAFRGELVPQDTADEPASVLLQRIAAERVAAPRPARKRNEKARA